MALPASLLRILGAIWKLVVGLSVILVILTSLQTLGLPQPIPLTIQLFSTNVSILIVVVSIASFFSAGYLLLRRRSTEDVLTDVDARWIVLACREPQTAEVLRRDYEGWKEDRRRRSGVLMLIPLPGFDDYIVRLERQGMIRYANDGWQATRKALEKIRRYHGGV